MGLANLRSGSKCINRENLGNPKNSKDGSLENGQQKSFKKMQKFQKKLQFYSKVKDTVVSLEAKKAIQKKKRVRSRHKKVKPYDLSGLSEFLQDLGAPSQLPDSTKLKINCKNKKKIVDKENKQLKAVLSHPAFHTDPIAAIHQHLQNTHPIIDTPKTQTKSEKKTKRRGKKGLQSGKQSMEIRTQKTSTKVVAHPS